MKGLLKKQVVLAILLATVSGSAFAFVLNLTKVSGGVSSTGGLNSSTATVAGESQVLVDIARENKCVDSRNYLSWDLLKTVALFENYPPRLEKIVNGDKVELQIFIPAHVRECLDPKIEISTVKKPKLGFFIKVRNRFFENNPQIVKQIFGSEEEMNRLTQDARLTKCFENRFAKRKSSKIVKKNGIEVVDDVVDIDPSKDMELGRVFRSDPVQTEDVDQVFAYMHSPYSGLVPREGSVLKIQQRDICYKAENFNMEDKETPIMDKRLIKVQNTLEECNGMEDCVKQEFVNYSTAAITGEFEQYTSDFQKAVENIFFKDSKVGSDNKEYKNISRQIEDIIEAMSGLAENMLSKDVLDDGEEIKKLSRKYDEFRYKLETTYINPLIQLLEKKYEMRKKARSEEEKKEIDDSIFELNNLIGKYADETGRADEVIVLLAAKGLSINANKAGELYFKSVNWSMVSHDEDGLSPSQAKEEIKEAKKHLVIKTKEAKTKYLVSTGKITNKSRDIVSKMRATTNNYQATMNYFDSREMRMQRDCATNQAYCNKYFKGLQARRQQRMSIDDAYRNNMTRLQGQAAGWRKYEMLGARYKRSQREARYGSSAYGGKYSSSRLDFGSADSYLFNNDNYYDDVSYNSMDYGMYSDYGLEFDVPENPFAGGNYMNSSPNQMLMQRQQQGFNNGSMYGGNNMNFGGSLQYGQGQMPY